MKIIASCKPKSKNSPLVRSGCIAAGLLCLAGLFACGHGSAPSGVTPARIAVVQPLAAPLKPAERARLGHELASIFEPYAQGGSLSLCVIDSTGLPAYSYNAAHAVIPASTQKIIVAASALRYLGSSYRFHTQFAAPMRIENGEVASDLWLVGSGDPILRSGDLRGGVKALAEAGLEHVHGGLMVDARVLGGPERNPLWDPTDAYAGFSSATSGISLDQDTIEFHVSPTSAGAPALVTLEPPNRVVTFKSSVITVPSGYATSVIITPLASENSFSIAGQIAATGHQSIYYLPVSRIPNYVANVVESMLETRGITTMHSGHGGVADSHDVVLWDHRSPPLRFIVRKMLFESNNHIAEQLLRTIGRAQSGSGDDVHGLEAEAAYLHGLHVPVSGMRVVDGSGLAEANRISALTLSTLLAREERMPGGNPLYLALPRGGIEGTVRFYHFGRAMGRVRAKSGHLTGVDALTGYVTTRRHGRLAFAFLVNANANQWAIDDAIAHAVDRLADF